MSHQYNLDYPPLGGGGQTSGPTGGWGPPVAPPRPKISISLSSAPASHTKKKKVNANQSLAPGGHPHGPPTVPFVPTGPPPSRPPDNLIRAGFGQPQGAYYGTGQPTGWNSGPYASMGYYGHAIPPGASSISPYTHPTPTPSYTPPPTAQPSIPTGRGPKLKPGQPVPKEQYTEEMRDYIRRAFTLATNDEEHAFVREYVDQIIHKAIAKGTALSRNWRAQQLPPIDKWRTTQKKKQKQQKKTMPSPMQRSPTLLGKRNQLAFQADERAINSHEQKQQRLSRFQKKNKLHTPPTATLPYTVDAVGQRGLHSHRATGYLQGTCTVLEKDFYRQTEEPDPALIRPEPVLREALNLVMHKWKLQQVDYVYMCNQFKSMRQDMTIQHIRNPFTIKVYETHARVALEQGDLNEFNQCQTRLKSLYDDMPTGGHVAEFLAYRLLYLAYSGLKQHMGPLLHAIQELTVEHRQMAYVQHALQVAEALISRNYHQFFQLYQRVENMGCYLMDKMLPEIRLLALRTITRAYLPQIPVSLVASQLHFQDESACIHFLETHGGIIIRKPGVAPVFNTRQSKITP